VDFANKAVGFQSTPAGIWDAAVLKEILIILVLRPFDGDIFCRNPSRLGEENAT
jgi:hypothetical protein